MKTLFTISSIALLAILAGCATIITGTTQTVHISSGNGKPLKAKLMNDGQDREIQLPAVVTVKRAEEPLNIQIVDACYNQGVFASQSQVNFWFAFGGLLGTTTDYATNAIWKYDANIVVPAISKENCK